MAAIAVASSWLAERWRGPVLTDRYVEMVAAARSMQRASGVVRIEKERLGLVRPASEDPNGTGLIGPEWSPLVTTQGDLAAKRTTTSPDLAAVLVRELAAMGVARGERVAVVMSGSFPGANIASLLAVQSLGAVPVSASSLGASMYGAADPEYTWLDMEHALVRAGVLAAPSRVVVLGGDMAVGLDLPGELREQLRARADSYGVPLVESASFASLVGDVERMLWTGDRPVAALVNVGGSMLGLGTCLEAHRFGPGVHRTPLPCASGEPGLLVRASEHGIPVLHLLGIRDFALATGLRFDPIPLPRPGNDRRVYGEAPRAGVSRAPP
jgi:poly-gamma-glutamate system protein